MPIRGPSRRRAALAFALVGLAAGAAHVAAETPMALRDWRQTLPLAASAGAAVGAALRPSSAREGLRAAAAAMAAFVAVFALGHGLIAGSAAAVVDGLRGAASGLFGPSGAVALAGAAWAGWGLDRLGRR